METEILILVRNRVPTIVNIREIITYNTDYTVRFDFDGEWDVFEHKTVYFVDETGNYTAVISSDDKCEFPLFENERRRIFIGVHEYNQLPRIRKAEPHRKNRRHDSAGRQG